VEKISDAIKRRSKLGTNFSIVAVAEGAIEPATTAGLRCARKNWRRAKTLHDKKEAKMEVASDQVRHQGNTMRLASNWRNSPISNRASTILGYVQRGGTPSAADRILATRLAARAATSSTRNILA